jgi:hypothetical protein
MGGWKKFEPFWNFMIRYGNLNRMLPVLEQLLANSRSRRKAEVMDVRKLIGKAAL